MYAIYLLFLLCDFGWSLPQFTSYYSSCLVDPDDSLRSRPCRPAERPLGCTNLIWNQLIHSGLYSECVQQQESEPIYEPIPETRAGPPEYLSVPSFDKCLKLHQFPGHSHTEWCLPSDKPSDCPLRSWHDVTTVFKGKDCPSKYQYQEQIQVARQEEEPEIMEYYVIDGDQDPAFYEVVDEVEEGGTQHLDIDGQQSCVRMHRFPGQRLTEQCLPRTQPEGCDDMDWKQIQQEFEGYSCPF